MSSYIPYITLAIGVVIGIIGFFLKRVFSRVDEHDRQIADIKENYAKKDDLDAVQESSDQKYCKLQERMEERFDRIESELKEVNRTYVTGDTFVREVHNLDNKLQRIYDLLIQKGTESK